LLYGARGHAGAFCRAVQHGGRHVPAGTARRRRTMDAHRDPRPRRRRHALARGRWRRILALPAGVLLGGAALLLALDRLFPPTSGEISIEGRDIRAMSRRGVARRVQPVFQDPYSSLNPRRDIASIVSLPLE